MDIIVGQYLLLVIIAVRMGHKVEWALLTPPLSPLAPVRLALMLINHGVFYLLND